MSLIDNDHACPVCGRPMRLLTTIRRVPGEQTLVLQCRPCGFSTTETVDAPQTRREHALTSRHPAYSAPARASVDHQHRGLHGARVERVQGFLAGLIGKEDGAVDEAVGTGGIGAGAAPDCGSIGIGAGPKPSCGTGPAATPGLPALELEPVRARPRSGALVRSNVVRAQCGLRYPRLRSGPVQLLEPAPPISLPTEQRRQRELSRRPVPSGSGPRFPNRTNRPPGSPFWVRM
jgi:hypothetical protein